MPHVLRTSLLVPALVCLLTGAAAAQGADTDAARPLILDDKALEQIGAALLWLFVIAALVQTALTVIFSWRWFIILLDGTGVKFLINLAFGLAIAFGGDLNAFDQIVGAVLREGGQAGGEPLFGTLGKLLTALILAGGTEAVHRLAMIFGLKAPPPVSEREAAIVGYGHVEVTRDPASKAPDMDVFVNDHFAGTLTREAPRFPRRWPWSAVGYPTSAGGLSVRVVERGAADGASPRLAWQGKIAPRAKLRLRVT